MATMGRSSSEVQELTQEDFNISGWETALQDASGNDYQSMSQALSNASTQAKDAGRESQGKVLQLLAFACSMFLIPESRKEPFIQLPVCLEGRSIYIPDGFADSHISFFAQIVDSDKCSHAKLKARLAELVWLQSKNKQLRYPLAAIDSYRSIPVTAITWWSDTRHCLERAIVLSKLLGQSADSRLADMEINIVGWIVSATKQDGFFACSLADVLSSHGIGSRLPGQNR